MMKREDFENSIDWVIYKINGRTPEKKKTLLKDNMVPEHERKYSLKYYTNACGRYIVNYHKQYICMCSEEDILKVQEYFDNHYNGNNIEKISETLKGKFNQKIKTKKSTRTKPFTKNNIKFQDEKTGRLRANVNDNGKIHHICQCYPNQKEEVSNTYDSLKKKHDLDTIKNIMKSRYNLKGQGKKKAPKAQIKHDIRITSDGMVYKDDAFLTVDATIYDFMNKYIGEK